MTTMSDSVAAEPGEGAVVVAEGCAYQHIGTDDDGYHWYAAGCPDPVTWLDILNPARAVGHEPEVVWKP